MVQFFRGSLLAQLLGVYLLFVSIVLATGYEANAVGQRQLKDQLQRADLAVAQEVSLDTFTRISSVENSLVELSGNVAQGIGNPDAVSGIFSIFAIANSNVGGVFWVDGSGVLRIAVPGDPHTLGTNLADTPLFKRALLSNGPVVETATSVLTGADTVTTVAEPVHDNRGQFLGIVAANLMLSDFSAPVHTVLAAQATQDQHVAISILDERGRQIASPVHGQLLRSATNLPGVPQAMAGQVAVVEGRGPGTGTWLYTDVPVPAVGWVVVVQRPMSDLAAASSNFSVWLFVATGLFALGGLLFWLLLVRRVVQPLHRLAAPTASLAAAPARFRAFTGRRDEIGGLARALDHLSHDVSVQLSELQTLLETSNAVVNSLDPRAVGETIIREVRRLVDVQSAAVLVPDEQGILRVLVSIGRAGNYEARVQVQPDQLVVPSARALRERRPVQMIDDGNPAFPAVSAQEGFRAILAVPILSQRVGNVVLVVHRHQPLPFTESEVDIVLTFANYATLAWEHAVLYERSDERLHEVARENERLYREADAEKRTLAAIMGSIRDGLVLASTGGVVLYANLGARVLLGEMEAVLIGKSIEELHEKLGALAQSPEQYSHDLARAEAGEIEQWVVETTGERHQRALQVRLFDVRDDAGREIGHGLLLRDITRERELDQFKTTLLAAVGHELRTPLAAIKGHASTLLQEDVTWPVEEQRHFLRTISVEADALARLVSNLLDLARSDAGLLTLRREPCGLRELVESVTCRFEDDGTSITLDLPDDLPQVEVDVGRIEVVVHNLLVNARKYGGGMVRVSACAHAGVVIVRVSDNGLGIDPEDAPHIFERFYRAEHALTQHIGGTGLGLAICKAFVEAHGGVIRAEPQAKGTCIAFQLPAAQSPDGPPIAAAAGSSGVRSGI